MSIVRLPHVVGRLWHRAVLALAGMFALFANTSDSQAQGTDRSIAFIADSIAASGDTVRAYALLDSALRNSSKIDGAVWHQFGLLNWSMAKGKRKGSFISDQRTIRYLQGADTALRLATKFAPDSARYWLSLGRFNLASGVATMRFAATS